MLQAYLERAKLPISDYINDTKTVIDQIPRLVAAMHYIAAQDFTIAGNLDLVCQFSRLRQIFKTRSLVDDHPLSLIRGFNNDVMRRIKRNSKNKLPTVWSLRSAARNETSNVLKQLLKGGKTNNMDYMLNMIYALPWYGIEELKVTHEVDKKSGRSIGKLNISLAIESSSQSRHRGGNNSRADATSLVLVLGTPQRKTLLAHTSVTMHNSNKKEVELSFDWSAANAGGGDRAGHMILRLLVEEHRGLDGEIMVPLRT